MDILSIPNCGYNYLNAFCGLCQAAEAKEGRCRYAEKERFTARKLAIVGLLSALVFVSSWMQIEVGPARFHLGNGFCALAGLLFGPLTGGLAAGFGSMLFDLTNPAYISGCLITFATKFVIGYLAGLVAHKGPVSTKRIFWARWQAVLLILCCTWQNRLWKCIG